MSSDAPLKPGTVILILNKYHCTSPQLAVIAGKKMHCIKLGDWDRCYPIIALGERGTHEEVFSEVDKSGHFEVIPDTNHFLRMLPYFRHDLGYKWSAYLEYAMADLRILIDYLKGKENECIRGTEMELVLQRFHDFIPRS